MITLLTLILGIGILLTTVVVFTNSKDTKSAIGTWAIITLIMVICVLLGRETGYLAGQIDYINGEVKYEQSVTSDTSYVRIK